MIYVLMTADGQIDYHNEFAGVFTDRELLDKYVIENPLPEPMSYYMLEALPDQPGVARRVDLAVTMSEIKSALEGSPIEMVFPEGIVTEGEWAPSPFSIEVFDKEHRSLLKIFETPSGQLEAQFKPGDLTKGCETFVREMQRLQMETFRAS